LFIRDGTLQPLDYGIALPEFQRFANEAWLGINIGHVLTPTKLARVFVGLVKVGRSNPGKRRGKDPVVVPIAQDGP
jgi:hypothetical protein